MLRNPDEEEEIPLRYRPLPSVDIALLPHELRAIRMQRLAIAGGVVGLLAVATFAIWGRGSHAESARAHAAQQKKPELEAPELEAENLHGDARSPRTHVAALAAIPLARGTLSTET